MYPSNSYNSFLAQWKPGGNFCFMFGPLGLSSEPAAILAVLPFMCQEPWCLGWFPFFQNFLEVWKFDRLSKSLQLVLVVPEHWLLPQPWSKDYQRSSRQFEGLSACDTWWGVLLAYRKWESVTLCATAGLCSRSPFREGPEGESAIIIKGHWLSFPAASLWTVFSLLPLALANSSVLSHSSNS